MKTIINLSTRAQVSSSSFTSGRFTRSLGSSMRRALPGLLSAAAMTLGLILFSAPASAQQQEESPLDILMRAWQERSRSEDITFEKQSDALRDVERVYDPSTGSVYEVDNGFYDTYDVNRNDYQMNNLEQLPDNDHDLWMSAPQEDEVE